MDSLITVISSVTGALVGLLATIFSAYFSRRTFFRQDRHVALRTACSEMFAQYMRWGAASRHTAGDVAPVLAAIYAADLLCPPESELHKRLTDFAQCLLETPPDAYKATNQLHLVWQCAQKELSQNYR